MNSRRPLFSLVAIVSLCLFAFTLLLALFGMPSDIPVALRALSAFLFPIGALACSPLYISLARRMKIDVKGYASEEALAAALERGGKAPLIAMVIFFAHTLILFLPYSIPSA